MCGIPRLHPQVPSSILVSLPDQLLYVYRNGVRIGRSTVSTGKPGKSTPTGVFTVLQKKVRHESSIYKGAQMPHMQRLTWTGVAMHAGNLPGYPASAGCVRLPVDFAANRVERLSGSYVFTALKSFDSSGRREWISTASSGRRVPNLKDLANRVRFPSDFEGDIRSLISPGTTLVITNLPVSTGTHSAPGFNILTS